MTSVAAVFENTRFDGIDPQTASRRELVEYVNALEALLDENLPNTEKDAIARLRAGFRLTNKEASLLFALSDGRMRTKEQLLTLMYPVSADEAPELKIIDVFICKLRVKIAGSGIRVKTDWGHGYVIDHGADRLRAVMAGARVSDLPPPVEIRDEPVMIRSRPGTPRRWGAGTNEFLLFLAGVAGENRNWVLPREFSVGATIATPFSQLMDRMVSHELIKVHFRPGRGGYGERRWKFTLTEKGRAHAAILGSREEAA